MLNRVRLQNFFSFGPDAPWIDLNPRLNILVGINGSGKTNFLKAIQLLAEGTRDKSGFSRLFNKWGGFDQVGYFANGSDHPIELSFAFNKDVVRSIDSSQSLFVNQPIYHIKIHRVGNNSFYLEERIYSEGEKGKFDFEFLKIKNGAGFISERQDSGEKKLKKVDFSDPEEVFDRQSLVLSQAFDPKKFHPIFGLKRAIERVSIYLNFNSSEGSDIRKQSQYDGSYLLKEDGSNLTQFLLRLSSNYPLIFDSLIDWLRKVNPFFKDIRFDVMGSVSGMVLTEKQLSRSVLLPNISDGTLRFLLLLSVLLNPEKGKLIGIDEPEISLHPDMILVLSQVFREVNGEGTQLFVATHSPILLNLFELSDVWILEKDEKNQTIMAQKSEEDFPGWSEDFFPGSLWLQGLLGGRR